MIAAGIVVVSYAIDERRASAKISAASVKDLQEFVRSTDDLERAYSSCQTMLEKHMFAFSHDIKNSCTGPISKKINEVTLQVERLGASLDAASWSEIDEISKLMLEDSRQGLIALEMTGGFEDEVVRSLKDMCAKVKDEDLFASRNKSIYEAGRSAMIAQLNYFFTIRDFILPALDSMKARVLVQARSVVSESIPDNMIKKANLLSNILHDRKNFELEVPKQPFTLSVIKDRSSRNIKISAGEGFDFIEQARWQQVLVNSRVESLRGRSDDIESLISCGVLKQEARKLMSEPVR
ncbi:hypothetical protein EAY64_09235 [Aquitalea palustris]|uniref:Uncharacterized protein n=1 Tax=Aquitalea palustris TaxID=2480983 RepID=A0A454JIY3_9NEIS|nr:hypothetical protein EAY64_09235 [Aquitalea palustris]